jgi:hypothetical protein
LTLASDGGVVLAQPAKPTSSVAMANRVTIAFMTSSGWMVQPAIMTKLETTLHSFIL